MVDYEREGSGKRLAHGAQSVPRHAYLSSEGACNQLTCCSSQSRVTDLGRSIGIPMRRDQTRFAMHPSERDTAKMSYIEYDGRGGAVDIAARN